MTLQTNSIGSSIYQFTHDAAKGATLIMRNTLETAWHLLNLTEKDHGEATQKTYYTNTPAQDRGIISENLDVGQPQDPSYIRVTEATSEKFKTIGISLRVTNTPNGNYTSCTEAVLNQLYSLNTETGDITERNLQ